MGEKYNLAGVAWVLRDARGVVHLHSRRSFAFVETKYDAHYLGLVWAIESMISHRCSSVYFSFEGGCFVKAINRPKAWPSFKLKVVQIRSILENFLQWKLEVTSFDGNRGARVIARSALSEARFQSYVAWSHPRWCSQFFGV